jgi:hypothetical protein
VLMQQQRPGQQQPTPPGQPPSQPGTEVNVGNASTLPFSFDFVLNAGSGIKAGSMLAVCLGSWPGAGGKSRPGGGWADDFTRPNFEQRWGAGMGSWWWWGDRELSASGPGFKLGPQGFDMLRGFVVAVSMCSLTRFSCPRCPPHRICQITCHPVLHHNLPRGTFLTRCLLLAAPRRQVAVSRAR